MALLGYQKPKFAGTTVNFVAASSGGDKVPANGRGCVLVKNADASAKTVTIAVPGNTEYGQAKPDFTVTVPAGATVAIGPFPSDLKDDTDALVHLTYSAVTALTIAAINT